MITRDAILRCSYWAGRATGKCNFIAIFARPKHPLRPLYGSPPPPDSSQPRESEKGTGAGGVFLSSQPCGLPNLISSFLSCCLMKCPSPSSDI